IENEIPRFRHDPHPPPGFRRKEFPCARESVVAGELAVMRGPRPGCRCADDVRITVARRSGWCGQIVVDDFCLDDLVEPAPPKHQLVVMLFTTCTVDEQAESGAIRECHVISLDAFAEVLTERQTEATGRKPKIDSVRLQRIVSVANAAQPEIT